MVITPITLADACIRPQCPPYVIAELACAHEGEFDFACRQVDAAIEAKASAVKFQVFTADGLVVPGHKLHDAYKRFEFSLDQWNSLAERARGGGLHVLVDVFQPWSLTVAEAIGADAVKVHSTNVTNPFFLEQVGRTGRPVLIGTGGTEKTEIDTAVDVLRRHQVAIVLVHGFQGYPTAAEDVQLRRMCSLANDYALPAGYAGHADAATDAPLWQNILAMGLGCSLLENHITLDRSSSRTDYHSSLLPDAFARMVSVLQEIHAAAGVGDYTLTDAEKTYRRTFKAFVVAGRDLPAGHCLAVDDLAFKRADAGLTPGEADRLLGRTLRCSVRENEPLIEEMFKPEDKRK